MFIYYVLLYMIRNIFISIKITYLRYADEIELLLYKNFNML